MMKKVITVDQQKGDLTGSSTLVIQAAIDTLSYIGGGTVRIGAGQYDIDNAVHLRSNVWLEGVPGETVFRKCDNIVSPLATDGDANERQITLLHPEHFEPGYTVTVKLKDIDGGFHDTSAVITEKEGNVFNLDRPLMANFCMHENAVAERNFSIISGYDCENVKVSGIVIDGNRVNNSYLGGCRNAGIFLFEAKNISIENCTVKNYNGDGISYQACADILVKNCECIGNACKGLHPGSGTSRTQIIGCKAIQNELDGIFVCWRVRHSVIEDCVSERNERFGLCIGHKDSDNIIRNNTIRNNKNNGIFFRNEPDPMGANDNLVENNILTDNGSEETGYTGIRIRGCTKRVRFIGNTISYSASVKDAIGILEEESASDIVYENNRTENCGTPFKKIKPMKG